MGRDERIAKTNGYRGGLKWQYVQIAKKNYWKTKVRFAKIATICSKQNKLSKKQKTKPNTKPSRQPKLTRHMMKFWQKNIIMGSVKMKDAALQEKLKKLDLQELIDFLEKLEDYENDMIEKADEKELPNVSELESDMNAMQEDIQSLKKDMEKMDSHTHSIIEPMEEE
mgnify:CR=1 FL=1